MRASQRPCSYQKKELVSEHSILLRCAESVPGASISTRISARAMLRRCYGCPAGERPDLVGYLRVHAGGKVTFAALPRHGAVRADDPVRM